MREWLSERLDCAPCKQKAQELDWAEKLDECLQASQTRSDRGLVRMCSRTRLTRLQHWNGC